MTDEEIILKRGNIEVVLTEKRIRDLTSKFLEKCGQQAILYDDFGMNCKVVDMLIDIKKVWYPETQKNINVNVDAFDDKLKVWLQARKEMKEARAETVVKVA